MTYLLSKLTVFKIYQFSACSLWVIIKSNIQPGIPLSLSPSLLKQTKITHLPLHPQNHCAHSMVLTSCLTRRSHLLNLTRQGGSSSHKLWIISKNPHQYDCVLNSSQIFTFVTIYCNFIQYWSWPHYLTLYACNYITMKFLNFTFTMKYLPLLLEDNRLCHSPMKTVQIIGR